MKSVGSTLRIFFTSFAILLLTVGCHENSSSIADPNTAFDSQSSDLSLEKKKKKNYNAPMTYPQTASHVFPYSPWENLYYSGNITVLPSRSVFDLEWGALTPPDSLWGQDVTITFTIDKDEANNELIFTFGPHGSQFSPAARVILDYSDLGIDIPTLYYIDENGNYIEQQPDDIDVNGKKLTLYIDHFSRYALAHG